MTERLAFRHLEKSDLDELHARMYSDAETMRYIRTGKPRTFEETEEVIRYFMEHNEKHGFSFMAVIERASGKFIGIAGLKYIGDFPGIEVGYLIEKSEWGKGYATEATKFFLEKAFNEIGVDKVGAVVMEENVASRKVLEKAGMKFVDMRTVGGAELCYYEIGGQ